jgi:hypothetical protein
MAELARQQRHCVRQVPRHARHPHAALNDAWQIGHRQRSREHLAPDEVLEVLHLENTELVLQPEQRPRADAQRYRHGAQRIAQAFDQPWMLAGPQRDDDTSQTVDALVDGHPPVSGTVRVRQSPRNDAIAALQKPFDSHTVQAGQGPEQQPRLLRYARMPIERRAHFQ